MLDPTAPRIGILIVGHGTKSRQGTAEFKQVSDEIARQFGEMPTQHGFLEHAEPSIDFAVELLASKGVTSVLAAPLMLFSASHAKMDIPRAVHSATQKRGISVAGQAEVLGAHPRLIELSVQRFRENGETSASNPAFVLVGRGGSDAEAQRATFSYLQACKEAAAIQHATHGFLAVAKPQILEHLESLGRLGLHSVVILPHLLFHGALVEKCRQMAAALAKGFPQTNWRLAGWLGSDEAVVFAAVDRIKAALESNLPKTRETTAQEKDRRGNFPY